MSNKSAKTPTFLETDFLGPYGPGPGPLWGPMGPGLDPYGPGPGPLWGPMGPGQDPYGPYGPGPIFWTSHILNQPYFEPAILWTSHILNQPYFEPAIFWTSHISNHSYFEPAICSPKNGFHICWRFCMLFPVSDSDCGRFLRYLCHFIIISAWNQDGKCCQGLN